MPFPLASQRDVRRARRGATWRLTSSFPSRSPQLGVFVTSLHGERACDSVKISGTKTQAIVESSPYHRWVLPDGSDWALFYRRGRAYLLRFPGLADFELDRDGTVFGCWCAPGVEKSTVEHLYHNQVLPLSLSRQGRLVVHASAVSITEECAVAFVGISGLGKSTLAAAFAQLAKPVICDDGLVIEWDGHRLCALPGHPAIRLWADSRSEFISPSATRDLPMQFTWKHLLLEGPSTPFCVRPSILGRVYFLGADKSAAIRVTAVPPPEALVEVIKHSFLLDVQDPKELASHFGLASRLAGEIDCFRLDYPRRFEALPDVRAAILKHCEG